MCLSKLGDFKVSQNYGWQIYFKAHTGKLFSRYYCFNNPISVGKWQRDTFRIFNRWIYIHHISDLKYRKGYHIFLNKNDAKDYLLGCSECCVKKVRFKRILHQGFQRVYNREKIPRYAKVVACRYRYVEPD